MQQRTNQFFRFTTYFLSVSFLATTSVALAQVQSSNGGWKRVGDPTAQTQNQPDPNYTANPNGDPNQGPPQASQPGYDQQPPPGYNQQMPAQNQGAYPNGAYPNQAANQTPPPPVPQQLTIPAGTFLTVRVNQGLSSDRNQAGDAFSATLEQPVVVNGVVVAEPGQTLGGRVAQAEKAGHIEGVARLAIQLTQLTLVDGQQLPIQAQLISRKGPTSVGQDAGTIATTTGLGAAIGAAADWGRGAAIGAGAGAAAGIIGVLVTRGHPAVIGPEQMLTFRLETPLTVSTAIAPQAFHYVQPGEYDRPPAPAAYGNGAPPAPYYGAPYAYPYPYYAWGYPYYWGPSFGFYFGRGYWWGGHYYRGYYGRGFRR